MPPTRTSSTPRARLLYLVLVFALTLQPVVLPAKRAVAGNPFRPASASAPAYAPTAGTDAARQRQHEARAGELLVRFRREAGEEAAEMLVSSKGARRGGRLRGASRVERLLVEAGRDPAAAAAELRAHPLVEFAEPNFIIRGEQVTPDDPRFGEQWALRNTGEGSGTQAGSDVRATRAWETVTGSAATVVAVIDSGVDFAHPELRDNRWVNAAERENLRDDDRNGYVNDLHGWDFVADTGEITDENGHGTAVAGIIAARGNNAVGVTGVMWQAGLMSLRVLDASGAGDVGRAVEAIDYAAAHGARVINCSWGTSAPSDALRDAINRAAARGVVVVAAAGNGGRDNDAAPHYPASFDLPNVIAVASTDGADRLAASSNWGAARVHVAAPGDGLLTTARGGGYATVRGTSAAAAVVSGAAGLLKTARPLLKPDRVREALAGGARVVPALAGRVSAAGVVDAGAALGTAAGWPRGDEYDASPEGTASPGVGRGADGGRPDGFGDDEAGPPPRPGKLRHGLPNLDEMRRRDTSDTLPRPSPARSRRPDYEAGDPVKAPGEVITADWVGTGSYNGSTLSVARLDPTNRVGEAGEDLFSGNYNWSLPLVELPGRAGLDLSLALSYNSLVWTKLNGTSGIHFDTDAGYPSPGFRLGLPVLQSRFYNEVTGKYAYLLVTPSGERVELRQVGATNVYEAADSSYAQLTDNSPSLLLRTSEGTQLTFVKISSKSPDKGPIVCTQIKDRNGNYITATYNPAGKITSVTDTLGRVLNFNYDVNFRLSTITQQRGGSTYTWATFGYTDLYVQSNFSGLTVFGPYYTTISVLSQVWTADSVRHDFAHNPFGQVYRIDRVAPAGNLLQRITYDLPTAATAQSDCPRFGARRDWAAEWNGDDGGTYSAAEEAVTTFAAEAGDVQTVTMPDGQTVHKKFFHTAGWQRGLASQTETWHAGARKKWTTLSWTQEDTGLSYPLNPRVAESNVYDAAGGRRRRTTIDYHAAFGLPWIVTEFAADAVNPLRRTYLEYKSDAAYVDRRIIGLPLRRAIYDGGGNLMAKAEYAYDGDANGDLFHDTPAPATQHDRTNYGPAFIYGRGNLSAVTRFDAADPGNAQGTAQVTKYRHNSTGSVLMERDHLTHQKFTAYGDSFADGANRNTFAYPTAVTDEDSFSSTLQYDFHTGLPTRTQDPKGAAQTFQYDAAGRPERINNLATGSYKRWVYPASLAYVQSFSTVNTAADEFYNGDLLDGFGRVHAAATYHPYSAGGYRAVLSTYDVMGRLVSVTNPTEIDGGWNAYGDDAAGWRSTAQTYDWQGRPQVTTHPDGATRQVSYDGCGCAGSQIVTTTDEVNRRQRTSYDVLGRPWKSEILNTDGTVYRTTTSTYDALDHVTRIDDVAAATGATQVTTMTYDGHGRLKTRRLPQALVATVFNYHADDTLLSETDGRGAVTTYGYNARHLSISVSSSFAGTTVGRTYGYDESGNRTQMTDGQGSATYVYNTASQLTSETRYLSGLGASYTLSYTYNLAGQLKTLTDPFNSTFTYNYDNASRLESVTGTAYGGVSTYAGAVRYRAWGGVKSASFGNNTSQTTQYNGRMQPSQYRLSASFNPNWQRLDYAYYPDGRMQAVTDLDDGMGSNPPATLHFMSRTYTYDHVGRVTHGGGANGYTVPFQQNYTYDAFGNMTSRGGSNGYNSPYVTDTATYTDNKRGGWTYDDDGRLTHSPANSTSDARTWQYDAAGRLATLTETTSGGSVNTLTLSYDGDGQTVREARTGYAPATFYVLHSAALGGEVVTRLKANGTKEYTYVPAGGLVSARQTILSWNGQQSVEWTQRDPAGVTEPAVTYDPLGNYVPHVPPQVNQPPPSGGSYGPSYGGATSTFANANNYSTGCTLDGRPADCNRVRHALANGQANPPGVGAHPLFLNIGPGASPISRFDYRYGNDGRGTEYVYTGGEADQDGGPKSPGAPQRSAESIKCDERLANIFGRGYKYGTRFATDFDPQTKLNPRGRNRLTSPEETPLDGHGHLYASETGEGSSDAYAFTPDGFSRRSGFPTSNPGTAGGVELQNQYDFYYEAGSLRRYGYSGALVISFVHIGPTNSRRYPTMTPNRSMRNGEGAIAIGIIGGFGNIVDVGGSRGDVHSHMRFRTLTVTKDRRRRNVYTKGAPIDPRKVFCSDLGFK